MPNYRELTLGVLAAAAACPTCAENYIIRDCNNGLDYNISNLSLGPLDLGQIYRYTRNNGVNACGTIQGPANNDEGGEIVNIQIRQCSDNQCQS